MTCEGQIIKGKGRSMGQLTFNHQHSAVHDLSTEKSAMDTKCAHVQLPLANRQYANQLPDVFFSAGPVTTLRLNRPLSHKQKYAIKISYSFLF